MASLDFDSVRPPASLEQPDFGSFTKAIRQSDLLAAAARSTSGRFITTTEARARAQVAIDRYRASHEPTPAQLAAGNYPKRHVQWHGMTVSVENEAGSVRCGVDPSGKPWETRMLFPYGYLRGTEAVDGDAVDVYIGPDEGALFVYVIHQRKAGDWLSYDEDKAFLNFSSEADAVHAFLQHYNDFRFLGPVTTLPVAEFVAKARATLKTPAMIKALDAELDFGADMLAKSEHGPIPAGAHWITVHSTPGAKGSPILVMPHPDGSMRVIGGAGGALNHLKLRSVKTGEGYKDALAQRQQAAQAKRKEQTAADKAAGIHGAKQEEKGKLKAAMKKQRQEFVATVAEAMGWSPEETTFDEEKHAALTPEAQDKARKEHDAALFKRAKEAVDINRKMLLADHDALSASGLGDMPLQAKSADVLSVADLDPASDKPAGLGFAASYGARAEKQGLTPDAVAAELTQVHGADQKPPEQVAAQAAKTAEQKVAAENIAKELDAFKLSNPETAKLQPKVLADAQKAAALVKAQKKLKMAEQMARQASLELANATVVESKDYVLEASDAEVEESARKQMEQDIKTIGAAGLLSEIDKMGGEESLGGHVGAGAFNALNAFSTAVGGEPLIDRSVVDVLGINAAAQVLARRIATDYSGDDLDAIRQGVEDYHVGSQAEKQEAAVAQARELADAAEAIVLPDGGTGFDLANAQELNNRRREAIKDAKRVLGQATGELQANAALVMALRQGAKDHVEVSLGKVEAKAAITQLHALGLKSGDYKLEEAGGALVATVSGAGLDRLAKPVDVDGLKQIKRNLSIIRGDQDEEGWLPQGFANRPDLAMHVEAGVAPKLSKPFNPPDMTGSQAGDVLRTDGGDPLKLYHGTGVLGHSGSFKTSGYSDAVYFAESPALAASYAEGSADSRDQADAAQQIFARHVAAKNPLYIDSMNLLDDDHAKIVSDAKKAGHDAIVVRNAKNGDGDDVGRVVMAFSGDQVVPFSADKGGVIKHPHHDRAFQHLGNGNYVHGPDVNKVNQFLKKNPKPEAAPSKSQEALNQSLRDYIGGRVADGDALQDILADAQSADFFAKSGNPDAYRAALDAVAPLKGEDGKLKPIDTLQPAFEKLADDFVASNYGPGVSPLHRQSFNVDQKSVDALHRALSATPEGVAAFKPVGDLTAQERGGLRKWWEANVGKKDAGAEGLKADLSDHEKNEPEKSSTDMFGEESINPDWHAWKAKRDDLAGKANAAGLDWNKYVAVMGSPAAAITAVQDLVRSQVVSGFAEAHNKLNPGAPLKVGKTTIQGSLQHLDAVDPAAREKRLADQKELIDSLRERINGKYAGGTVADKMAAQAEAQAAFEQAQMGFFSTEELGGDLFGGGDHSPDAGKMVAPKLGADERFTLGHAAEQKVAGMMSVVGQNFRPGKPTKLWNASMSGKYAPQQRAIKLLAANKRLVLGYGAGSGKTGIMLGATAHLIKTGAIKRALHLVPSIVQEQYGGEATRYLEPGQFKWHCQPGASQAERIAAYKDPSNHFTVMTHESFRADMLAMGAQHAGITPDEMNTKVAAMSPEDRKTWAKSVMDKEGIDFGATFVDEAHQIVNRAGKENSARANVIDAVSDNTPYYTYASGDPIKNDISEAHDVLSKMDRARYQDRDAFMRMYGGDSVAAKSGLKRELARYGISNTIAPDVKADYQNVTVPLSDEQRTSIKAIDKTMARLGAARAGGKVDVEAARALSPQAFEGAPDDQHEVIAKGIQDSAGIVRESAIKRVINAAESGNSKVAKMLELADKHKGQPGVVFAHNRAAVAQIVKALQAKGHKVTTITGSDSALEKAKSRARFQPESGEPEADIMVCSDAGAVGQNLQRGQWLVQHDVPDTAKDHGQRAARIHRLGQKNNVSVYTLASDHKSERTALSRLQKKYGLREMMLDPMDGLDDTGVAGAISKRMLGQQQASLI